jgi:rhodanese-related sulfurtransferase/protein-L-isoaspartate O-methyltransferase
LGADDRFVAISGDELYRQLALGRPVVLLDVRTEPEFAQGHIPGSQLIPLHDLESRVHELPTGEVPIAIVSEQGTRSLSACRLLAEYGIGPLRPLGGGFQQWPGPRSEGAESNGAHPHGLAPSSFLVEHFHLLPEGLALDIAMGEGRNAIYLATRGFDVDGVEVDPRRVARARASARKLGAPIRAIVGNVEDGTHILPIETYDVIVVFNYLHRPLFCDIRESLVRGGVVVYQTYTVEQAAFGKPTNPAYLLEKGELKRVFHDWEHLVYREFVGPARRGDQRALAGIVARKP